MFEHTLNMFINIRGLRQNLSKYCRLRFLIGWLDLALDHFKGIEYKNVSFCSQINCRKFRTILIMFIELWGFFIQKKFCKRKTLNLLNCADSSPNTKKSFKYWQKNIYLVSHITCDLLLITCHLSVTPKITAIATNPPSFNSPNINRKLVGRDPKTLIFLS